MEIQLYACMKGNKVWQLRVLVQLALRIYMWLREFDVHGHCLLLYRLLQPCRYNGVLHYLVFCNVHNIKIQHQLSIRGL